MIPSILPQIIYQDDDIIVVEKPSGMTVNRSETTAKDITLQDWIENQFKIQSEKFKVDRETDFYKRSGIVHRLDKETSGIILIAKTKIAFEDLQRQFKERVVEKSYQALVHGKMIPPEGEISVPVGRLEYNRKRFGVVAGGRESTTFYKTLNAFTNPKTKETLSLLELYPKTGRTHQIRVHVKYLNHPIVSDELYGGRKTARNDRKILHRLFLHAAKISFVHPTNHEKITFESTLPQELQEFLDYLQVFK